MIYRIIIAIIVYVIDDSHKTRTDTAEASSEMIRGHDTQKARKKKTVSHLEGLFPTP